MLRKKILGFILISCVCVSIFSVLYLKDEKINNENANDLTNQNINLDLPKNSYSIFDFSPFLNHSEEDLITYTYDLYDATTPQQSYSNDEGTVIFPYYPHSFNDSKEFTVIDNDYYSADQFYYIMGAGYQIGAMGNVLFYLDTPFYDDTPGEEGFYHRLDEDLTILDSGNKTAFDNLLAIVPAFPGMEASINDASFFPTMTDLWNNSKNLFYSENNINGFNQSTSGLDSSSKYSRDNYLAAIVGFQMAKSPYFNIENPDAATYISYIADKIMNDFTYDTALDATIGFRPSYSLVGESYTVLQSSIGLIDNALAISAHLAWNIAGGMNQTSENVTKSEGIWRSIYDNLYNSTYDMYMSTCGTNGAMINYNMTLVDNSWMLRATLDLFKSTGNITYYNAALAHFNGIESNMYNSTNCSYYSTINIDQEKIESKTMEGYNNLIASLMQFQEIYDWTVLTPLDLSNSLNHMYLINNTFNISINVNISHDFSYDAVNSHWSISAPINNSQIIYTLRYANNDTIIHSQVGITDSNGTDNYEYEYPTSLPIGYYKLSVLANCSNYANPISEMINNIKISSGIEAISITQVGETIFPGEKTLYNISITSIRSDNLTVNIKNDGDSFDEEILNDINVENDTTTYVLMNVSVKDTVDWVEDQEIIVTIYNNSLEMKSITPSISVSSPLSFIELFFEKEIIFPNPFDITISFQNLRTITPESSIKVEVNGIGIESHSETISESIAAQEIKTFEVSISPETDTLPGLHTFQVNLSKDGISFWLNEYTVEIVPEIEILEINGFSSIIQGQMPYITFKIVNNNESSKPVSITSNGINIAEDYLLNPGENVFTVDIDGVLIHPYDITQKNYEIKVYNENGDLIGLKTLNIDLLLSPGNLFFFYILPIIVPVGILLYFQHKKIEEEKRSK